MAMSTFVACLCLGLLFTVASAYDSQQTWDAMTASHQSVGSEKSLFEKLAETSENGAIKYSLEVNKTIPAFEAVLSPILRALPRNQEGKLDGSAVRYALHRTFVQMRGYHLEGLQSPGAAWNSSFSTSEIQLLHQMQPAMRQTVMQSLDNGLGPNDVVVLAASLNMFIHLLGIRKLKGAYDKLDRNLANFMSAYEAKKIIELYVASQILEIDLANTKIRRSKLFKAFANMSDIYPSWNETQVFIHDVLASKIGGQQKVSFKQIVDAGLKTDDSFGPWQNHECLALKSQLMKMEDGGSGRIRLANFYNKALGGHWQFTESVPYLRKNGALDESNPNNLRVIIPNYINGLSNCIGASSYHKICCISECESLFSAIERQLGKPEASPEELATLIAALPSSTVIAPRVLPELMMIRLRAIAINHDGLVPIHGRMFQQLLHHAYPRECDFPHLANTTQPASPHTMVRQKDQLLVSEEEMRHRATERPPHLRAPLASVPWISQEELPYRRREQPPYWLLVHCCAAVVAMVTVVCGFTRMAFLRVRRSGLAVRKHQTNLKGPFLA